MTIADKLQIFDHIDEKYVVEATPKHLLAFGSVKMAKEASKYRTGHAFLETLASVAAIFLVIGMIFVWTLVGKDILHGEQGQSTTDVTSTTEPQTTPNNVVVPPVTDITTTTPVVTTTPIVTTIQTPITTTQPPVTTTPITTVSLETLPSFEQVLEFDADEVVKLISKAGCPDDKLPTKAESELSDNDVEKIIEFFKEPEAMAFINSYKDYNFYSPEEMDLAILLYNNVSRKFKYTEEDKKRIVEAIIAKYPEYYGEVYDLMRLTTQECEMLVKKYLGLNSVNDYMKRNLTLYIESEDAYFADNGGVLGFCAVDEINAWRLADGNILVLVLDTVDEEISTVVLKPNGNSYLFVQSVYLPEYEVWK